jgi:hypothetical protein
MRPAGITIVRCDKTKRAIMITREGVVPAVAPAGMRPSKRRGGMGTEKERGGREGEERRERWKGGEKEVREGRGRVFE